MKKTLILLMVAISATAIVFSGCTSDADTGAQVGTTSEQTEQSNQGGSDQKDEKNEGVEEDVIKDFEDLIASDDVSPKDLSEFLSDNASKVSKETVSDMIIGAEDTQKEFIVKLEEIYFVSEVQEKFWMQYKDGAIPKNVNPDEVIDADLKSLLEKTISNGYRLETAEGTYFPIIDYSVYKDFASLATDDVAAYLSIMEKESGSVPAKDAVLIIGWKM